MIKFVSVADSITLINAALGFVAILMAFADQLRFSFSLIFLALLADGLDGMVARKTGMGEIGEYLEAMADLVSLAVAPMIFVYTIYSGTGTLYRDILLVMVLLLFLMCSLIRLSSFHLLKEKQCFIGLPASASTSFILVLALLEIEMMYLIVIIAILSLGMVSPIRFPKIGLKISAVAAILIVLTMICGKMYQSIAPIVLLMALTIYVIVGPVYLKKHPV
jgi:CDP-diacylglycerol--serine O-phosphatidyltransferase